MLTLSIEFLAGRYHATSWDHHVNEGTVEWPPSPWRLVRALLAASYRVQPAMPEALLRRVLEPLLAAPSYAVPAATIGHTRHYMPTDNRDKPTKVFDAFVVPDGRLEVSWPSADLSGDELAALDRVLWNLTYVGRAESWTEVRRLPGKTKEPNCVPDTNGSLELWAAQSPTEYMQWRTRWDEDQRQLPTKMQRLAPNEWWDVLHARTTQLFKDGWSRPPGTERIHYRFAPVQALPRARSTAARQPTVARFELSSTVLPRLTEALPVGERLRMALLAWSDGHPVFVGRDAAGQVERGHPHAWYLAADDDADGFLDHVVVYSRSGFDRRALRALEQVRRVWGYGGHDLELVLVSVGEAEDLGGQRRDVKSRGLAPQLGPARVWESHTPFVPPRHTKWRGGKWVDTAAEQVARLLAANGFPVPIIEPLAPTEVTKPRPPKPLEWYRFRRIRSGGGGRRGSAGAFGFRLRFETEVTGPIAVGYAAHQGLGQFVAIE